MDAGAPETEITPEMIEAGIEILWNSGAVEHPLADCDKELIRKIFFAMLAASAPSQAKDQLSVAQAQPRLP
jgi:hypothetical protein